MLKTKSIGLVGIINALSTVLGLLYSVVLARYFGVGSSIEVYFASTTLLFLINSLTQSGQLAEIALPIYHKYQNQEGQDAANRVMSVIFNWMGVIALGFTLASFLGAPWLFYWSASGFDPDRLAEGIQIFRIISPLLFVEIMKSQISSMVNAEKKFGRIEWVNILNQVTSMAFIIFFSGKLQVYAVVLGLWVGELIAVGYGIYVLSRTNFRYHAVLHYGDFKVGSVLKSMTYTFAYVIVTQGFLFYMNNLLTHLPKGTYAVYKYAMLIFTKIQGLLVRPVSTIFFSQFSSAFHARSEKLRQLVEQTTSLSFVLSAFVFSGMMACGHALLRLLWEGEKFNTESIAQVYTTLTIVSSCLFFNSLALVFRKISMTLGKVKEQYLGYIAVQLLSALILFLIRDQVSLGWILAVFLINTVLLNTVPVLITKWTSPVPIPVNIGEKGTANLLFLLTVSLSGWGIDYASKSYFSPQPALLILISNTLIFMGFALAAAFVFQISELRYLRSVTQRITSRL